MPLYELWQDGIVVASVSSPSDERSIHEILHYAGQYWQDGPLEIRRNSKVVGTLMDLRNAR